MRSARTIARDAIVREFEILRNAEFARIRDFEITLRWITDQETKGRSTYCLVMTDETRFAQTLKDDSYDLTAVQVLYAYDTEDPRAKLDAMIEDAVEAVLRAANGLKETIWKTVLQSISTDEGTTAAGPWAQAVLRWTLSHRRQAVAA